MPSFGPLSTDSLSDVQVSSGASNSILSDSTLSDGALSDAVAVNQPPSGPVTSRKRRDVMIGQPGALTERIPTSLNFGLSTGVTNIPYFDPQPAQLIDFTDTFGSTGTFTRYTESTQGTFTTSGGVGTVAHVGAQNDEIAETSGTNTTIPNFFISVDVPAIPTPCTTGYDNAGVGLVKDANNFIFASCQRLGGQAAIQIKIGGTSTFLATVSQTFTPPFSLGFGMDGNNADVWYKPNGGSWTQLTNSALSQYDFTANGALSSWNAAFAYASGGSGTWEFANLKCGRYGGTGMRDMTIVTNPDGSPYTIGTKVYFTATITHPSSVASCGIYTLDLSNNTIAQTGSLQINRGGKAYRDSASHIIAYPNGDRRLTITTWGNGVGSTLVLLHNLFTHGVTPDILTNTSLLSMNTLSIPLGVSGVGCYDPFLVYDGSKYWLAYAITNSLAFTGNPFYPALATSPDLVTWTLVGADTANQGWEGPKILKANNKYWIMAGGPSGSGNSSRVYDSTMTYQGSLAGAVFTGGADTNPHPMIFNDPDKVSQTLLTFNNTRYGGVFATWGQPSIQKSPRYT